MDIKEAIINRHSVRHYKDRPIDDQTKLKLEQLIASVNEESGLHFQLFCDDPECFAGFLVHFGRFKGVSDYIAIVGNTSLNDYEEACGYYGEKLVLEAQMMGLNSCWVGGSFSKGKCKAEVKSGEKLLGVIAIGYGVNNGSAHKSKPAGKLCTVPESEMPDWFKEGVKAAMQAPTALNQQKFTIELQGDVPKIISKGGPYTSVDLGIVKYNFEAASGHKVKLYK